MSVNLIDLIIACTVSHAYKSLLPVDDTIGIAQDGW